MRLPKSSPHFRLTRAPVGSGDRAKRRSREGSAHELSASRRYVETSGDVIEQALPTSAKIVEHNLQKITVGPRLATMELAPRCPLPVRHSDGLAVASSLLCAFYSTTPSLHNSAPPPLGGELPRDQFLQLHH